MKNAAFSLVAIFLAATSALAEPGTQIIATTDDAAPDGNGTFFVFEVPVLNNAGQMAISGGVSDTSGAAFIEGGLFRGDAVTPLLQLARQFTAAPNGGTYTSLDAFAINAAGQVVFEGSTSGGVSGIYRSDGATTTTIIHDGENAPGGGTFVTPELSAMNNLGRVVFVDNVQLTPSTGATSALFYGDGITTTQIAREGQSPPTGGGTYKNFGGALINDAGQVAFEAAFSFVTGEDNGIYRSDGSTLTHLVRVGDTAPAGGGTFNDLRGFAMNSNGLVVFTSTLLGSSNGVGIFSNDGTGGMLKVVRAGDAVPDGNGTLAGFSAPALNDAGQVAFAGDFIANTSGGTTDDEGIFRRDAATLVQIAREGQAAPDGNGSFSTLEDPALNEAGQIAFLASLTGTAGGSADDHGLFLYDDTLGLLQIAREGSALLGSTITGLDFNDSISLDDDDPSGLNNLGQVAYRFSLADGRIGIALWSISGPTIPGTGGGTVAPLANPNAALKASLNNKIKKLKKKAKAAKKKKKVATAKKFKKKIKKLTMQLAAL